MQRSSETEDLIPEEAYLFFPGRIIQLSPKPMHLYFLCKISPRTKDTWWDSEDIWRKRKIWWLWEENDRGI